MKIERIEQHDSRFSKQAVDCHMAYVVEDNCVEFQLLDIHTARIKYMSKTGLEEVCDEMHFYAGHIDTIVDEQGNTIKTYEKTRFFTLNILDIQPSQFYISALKLDRLSQSVQPQNICIPVVCLNGEWVSCDGHTRLKYLEMLGVEEVIVYQEDSFDYIEAFVKEAKQRGITSIAECQCISQEAYEKLWHQFCDDFFAQRKESLCG